jgi:hypothetical protein
MSRQRSVRHALAGTRAELIPRESCPAAWPVAV